MNGIFYFSGTGNSLWLAKKVKESLGGEIRYIPNWNGDISAYDKLIIVCPVYSFGLPLPVFDFMKELNSDAPLWIYQRLLDYIRPDMVHVLAGGRIVASGGPELALELEAEGYDRFVKAAA